MEKKKIAFIIDTEGWAFDNIAKQIQKNLTQYKIDIIPGRIFEGNMIKLFLFCEDYDLIHFMWRGYLSLISTENMERYAKDHLSMTLEEFKEKYIKTKKVTFSVCDHLYLEGEDKWRTKEILPFANSYMVTSQKLYDIYSQFDKKPSKIIHDGVDLKLYQPLSVDRFEEKEKLTVGWVGNSKFKDSSGDEDLKGVEGIIKPAIEELQKEGRKIELNLADRNIKMIPQEEMPNFYRSIDLYVCASKTEGTPLTVLESMAMAIPVISTDVGVVAEALGEKGKKYILEERTKQCLKEKLIQLMENRGELKEIAKENLERVKEFDWKKLCLQYQEFFESNF